MYIFLKDILCYTALHHAIECENVDNFEYGY